MREKYSVLKSIIRSVDSEKIKINSLNYVSYDDGSALVKVDSDNINIDWCSDSSNDAFVFNFVDGNYTCEIALGSNDNEKMEFISIERKALVNGDILSSRVVYTTNNGTQTLQVNKDGKKTIVSNNGVKKLETEDKTIFVESEYEILFLFKAVLFNNYSVITGSLMTLKGLVSKIYDCASNRYKLLGKFEKLLNEASQDEIVVEYVSICNNKAIQENIIKK